MGQVYSDQQYPCSFHTIVIFSNASRKHYLQLWQLDSTGFAWDDEVKQIVFVKVKQIIFGNLFALVDWMHYLYALSPHNIFGGFFCYLTVSVGKLKRATGSIKGKTYLWYHFIGLLKVPDTSFEYLLLITSMRLKFAIPLISNLIGGRKRSREYQLDII